MTKNLIDKLNSQRRNWQRERERERESLKLY
jgi:hypothetical protein